MNDDALRTRLLELFRFMVHAESSEGYADHIIEHLSCAPVSSDPIVNVLLEAAMNEMQKLGILERDKRPFPELLEYCDGDAAAIIVSFLSAPREFINSGYDFVSQELIYPVVAWYYSLRSQLHEVTLDEFLQEHDPDVLEFAQILL